MRLKALRLRNFRAFVDATVDFERVTILAGPNAVGKTTILEGIRFLLGRPRSGDRWTWLDLVHRMPHFLNREDYPAGVPVVVIGDFVELSANEVDRFGPFLDDKVLRVGARLVDAGGDERREGLYYVLPTGHAGIDPPNDDARFWNPSVNTDLWELDGWIWRHELRGQAGFEEWSNRLLAGDAYPEVATLAAAEQGPVTGGLLEPLIRRAVREALEILPDKLVDGLVAMLNVRVGGLAQKLSDALGGYLGESSRLGIDRSALQGRAFLESALAESVGEPEVWVAPPRMVIPDRWDWQNDDLPPGSERLVDLGTGVQRAVSLAALELQADVPADRNVILLIDEPERGLHPAAQRRVAHALGRMRNNSSAQAIISTHSAAILRTTPPNCIRVLHTVTVDGVTRSEITAESDYALASEALGVSPADILLAEHVIVVEGETDAFALAAWARTLGKTLDETQVRFFPAGGHGRAALVSQLVDLVYPMVRVSVVLDAGTDPEKERDRIARQFGDRVDVVISDFHDIEAAIHPEALRRWLRHHEVAEPTVEPFLESAARKEPKSGLERLARTNLKRGFNRKDFEEIVKEMVEAEISHSVRGSLARLLID